MLLFGGNQSQNDSKPVLGEARPGQTWISLKSLEWRAFIYDYGAFLLHIPSSTVLETDLETAQYVMGLQHRSTPKEVSQGSASIDHESDYAEALSEIAKEFPTPPRRKTQVNITALSLNMAQGCNLRCTYCFAGEGDYGAKGMMTFDTAQKAISLLSQDKERFHLIFFGGEPLLNFKVIKEIVDWTKSLSCRFTFAITTNGTLLTEEKIKWLNAHNFVVTISYDGKGAHGKHRLNKDKESNSEALVAGKLKAFESSLLALKSLRLRATVTKDSLNLDMTEEAILHTLNSFHYKLSVGRHAEKPGKLAFTLEDIDKLVAVIDRVIERMLRERDFSTLKRFETVMGFVKSIHRQKTRQMSCGAGVQYLTVSVAGTFHLCHRFNEDTSEMYGSIEEGLNLNALEDIAKVRNAEMEPCKSCFVREFCAGGCFHEHKLAHGSKFVLDEGFCRLLGSEVTLAMKVYTYLVKNAPEVLEDL